MLALLLHYMTGYISHIMCIYLALAVRCIVHRFRPATGFMYVRLDRQWHNCLSLSRIHGTRSVVRFILSAVQSFSIYSTPFLMQPSRFTLSVCIGYRLLICTVFMNQFVTFLAIVLGLRCVCVCVSLIFSINIRHMVLCV